MHLHRDGHEDLAPRLPELLHLERVALVLDVEGAAPVPWMVTQYFPCTNGIGPTRNRTRFFVELATWPRSTPAPVVSPPYTRRFVPSCNANETTGSSTASFA